MNRPIASALAIFCCFLSSAFDAGAQVYEKVFDFADARAADLAGSPNKGAYAAGRLVQSSDGNFYGMTSGGGASGKGTVFRMTPAGAITTLVEFTGTDGSRKGDSPSGDLVQGNDGNFYGTTTRGGANDAGTVFRMTPAGVLTTLVEFTGSGASNRGLFPQDGLVRGSDGNFYGTTYYGGYQDLFGSYGTVFRMTPAGVLTTLVEFTGSGATKGCYPRGRLVQGSDGNFYGTTVSGGIGFNPPGLEFGNGTAFRMTPGGALTTLVEFTGNGASNKGSAPSAGLVQGSDGNLYGTTVKGGASDDGTVFRLTSSGVLTTLVEFTGNGAANKGAVPSDALVQSSDGNFYGTTRAGGNGSGTVFRMTSAGVLTTLVEFTGNDLSNKGSAPYGLLQGGDGNFYGTTEDGGMNDDGTVFRITPAGALTTLVEFGAARSDKGISPHAGLVQGSDGNLYGTTYEGGANYFGTVFRITPTGTFATLVQFTNHGTSGNGIFPDAGLVEGSDGNFYGTTQSYGQAGPGTVFRMTPAGDLSTLVEFTGDDVSNKGAYPSAELVQGSDGNFYGTTADGGANDDGTVFRMTPTGVLTTLVEFTGDGGPNKGRSPDAGLVEGSDGNFYGTTQSGGANNYGTVFRITPAGVLTTLVEFTRDGPANKGAYPLAGLVEDGDGNFYGTTSEGGANGSGTVFRMTPDGALTTLVDFTGEAGPNKGSYPTAGLLRAGNGNFYGTTQSGGANGYGTVFRMTSEGVLTTLLEFASDEEGYPIGGLIMSRDGNLYGTTSGAIYRLIMPGMPTALLRNMSIQSGSVIVEVQANARGLSTNVSLEYGTDDVTFPSAVSLAKGLSGFQTKLIGTTLSDLNLATTYFYRIRATSSAGTTVTPVQSFLTLAAPVMEVGVASEVTPTSARFNGTVNARTFDTTVFFDWGTDGFTFPNTVPAVPGTVTGDTPVPVSAAVAVAQGSTIYFRIRATNAGGTVITGARGFNTGLGVTTSALNDADVGVTDVVFRATINTFGQTASVKFKYWADSTPREVLETATQTVTSSGPVEVSARVIGLAENTSYSYRVSVELAGTETEGDAVAFATETNAAPVAANDLVFYAGQVVVDPLANDTDPNDGTSASLMLDPVLVVPPNASLGVASVTSDRRFISYNPQFNVRDDDSLTYRVVDPLGASAQAQVRLIAFSKRAGLYGGKIVFGSGETGREGQVAVQMGGGGAISTSFMNWPNATERLGESFVLKGVFDQRGRFSRTLNSPSGAVLTLSLQLDADLPQMHGVFEERVNGLSTTGEIAFTLILNAGTGGLAEGGLRTGFLSPPSELASVTADGYVRMTVGKDAKRGARFAGRLPDGEPFLASAKAQGRTYELTRKLEQGGMFTGLVRALDGSTGAAGMMGDLYWQKHASSRAKFYRGGVETMLSLSGAAYPSLAKNTLPPIGLGTTSPNARLRLNGGDLPGTYRDLLLNILPGGIVQIVGSDPMQTGADIPTNKLQIKVDARGAGFSGRFLHPGTDKTVTFEGAFRVPFDEEPGQGRGVFRGPNTAGAAQILTP